MLFRSTEEPVSLEHKNIELKLDGGYFCESANEELLDLQKNEYDIMPHLLEKLYYNGLYGMQACAGTTAPRLSGLWLVSGICCGEVRTQWMPMLIFRFRE